MGSREGGGELRDAQQHELLNVYGTWKNVCSVRTGGVVGKVSAEDMVIGYGMDIEVEKCKRRREEEGRVEGESGKGNERGG